MARPLRIEYPGAVYHVTARGNAQQAICKDDSDRYLFLEVLSSTIKRYNWLCHAYCLMDNHYHLLLETLDPNLSLGMRQLNGVYTQRYNRVHSRVGHLFQGRFKSIVVEKESYLLELCRYIVLNPVAAHIVEHPSDYEWSSYRFTVGSIKQPEFLHTAWLLAQFTSKKKIARKRYREFVTDGMSGQAAKPWKKCIGQVILGSDNFVSDIQGLIDEKKEFKEIPKRQRYSGRPSLKELFPPQTRKDKKKRNKAINGAHFSYGYTMKELADFMGVHYSTVSRIIKTDKEIKWLFKT